MPIVGLTDSRRSQFPEIGTLRKGAAKPNDKQPGRDLTFFRFDTADDDARRVFETNYGAEPRAINIFLPFENVDDNFETWREEWTAGSLKHRCDGVNCQRRLLADGRYTDEPAPCPGGCKPSGRLKVIIPELRRLAYVTALTTSVHDIVRIHANLSALYASRGNLQGIPLILRRTPEMVSTPRGGGQRVRAEKWLISIEAAPDWVRLQLSAQQQAALPMPAPLALAPMPDDEDDDVIDVTPERPQSIPMHHQKSALVSTETAERIADLWAQIENASGRTADLGAFIAKKGAPDLYSLPADLAARIVRDLETTLAKVQREAQTPAHSAESGAALEAAIARAEAAGITPEQWQAEMHATTGSDAIAGLTDAQVADFMALLDTWAESKEKKAQKAPTVA